MTHPSRHYIRYLLAESWGQQENAITLETLNATLKMYGLLEVTSEQFLHLSETFGPPPAGFRFNNRKDKTTVDFMKSEKIHSMWSPDEDMSRTMKWLLGQNLVSEKIQILLMGDVPSEVIADKVSKKFRINPPITSRMIDYYRHYYWDVMAFNYAQWHERLFLDVQHDAYMSALLCGDQQALYRAGFNPKYDPKQALRDTHRQVTFRIQFLSSKPDDKSNVDQLVKLSREERSLFERLWGEGGGLKDRAREVRQFLMEHHIPDVKKLDEFIGDEGSISDDGSINETTSAEAEPEDGEEQP